jgi:hypothetical protein
MTIIFVANIMETLDCLLHKLTQGAEGTELHAGDALEAVELNGAGLEAGELGRSPERAEKSNQRIELVAFCVGGLMVDSHREKANTLEEF